MTRRCVKATPGAGIAHESNGRIPSAGWSAGLLEAAFAGVLDLLVACGRLSAAPPDRLSHPLRLPFAVCCRRLGPVWLLSATLAVLGASSSLAAAQDVPAVRLDACGAMTVEPGLGETAGGPSRPGQTLLPGDKGFGCRFTLLGEPKGSLENVEVRLSRPGAVGGGEVRDRWFVPTRRGGAALAAYAFAGPDEVGEGVWTLELYLADVLLAQTRFEAVAAKDAAVAIAEPSGRWPAAPKAPVAAGSGTPSSSTAAGPFAATDGSPNMPAPAAAPASATPPAPAPVAATPPDNRQPVSPPSSPKTAAAVKTVPAPVPAPKPPAVAASPERGPVRGAAVAPGRTPPPAAAKAPVAAGFYALQTGLFVDAENAEGQATRLRARGLPACLAVEGEGSRRRYRVLAGRFGDRRAAQAFSSEVRGVSGVAPLLFPVDAAQAARLRCH
jgi:cell division protein FtsN